MSLRTSRTRFGWFGLVLSVLLLLLALAGLAAPFFAGRWIELDLFSHLRLHFIGVAVFAFVAVFCRRAWPLVLAGGLCAVPVIVSILPSLSLSSRQIEQTVDGEVPVKVLTYNTWFSNQDWPGLEAYLRMEDADVVVMMEFGGSKRPLLENLKELYPHQADCIDVKNCRLVLLSKRPFVDSGHKTKWQGPPIIWARYGDDLGSLTVVGTHLWRPPTASVQLQQVRELARQALKLGDPIVVAGDFNATRWSFVLDEFETSSGMGRLSGDPTWPTFFFGFPQFGIDHIFISSGIRALGRPSRGQDIGSDHLPLSATLAVSAR